jgi:hypothetical protein
MLQNCECGRIVSDRAEVCMGCGGPNLRHPGLVAARVRRGASDVLWGLLVVAIGFYLVAYFLMLSRAENIMQQTYAAADTMTWTVVSYVIVRAMTSALKR